MFIINVCVNLYHADDVEIFNQVCIFVITELYILLKFVNIYELCALWLPLPPKYKINTNIYNKHMCDYTWKCDFVFIVTFSILWG